MSHSLFSLVSTTRALILDLHFPPFQSQPSRTPPSSVSSLASTTQCATLRLGQGDEVRSASAFSRTFPRLRFPDDPPPNPLAPHKLCVNYFINSCHLVTLCYYINFCHLLILCYVRILYMYLLCTPDNTTLTPVLSSACTLCAKILFQHSSVFGHRAILIWGIETWLGASRRTNRHLTDATEQIYANLSATKVHIDLFKFPRNMLTVLVVYSSFCCSLD